MDLKQLLDAGALVLAQEPLRLDPQLLARIHARTKALSQAEVATPDIVTVNFAVTRPKVRASHYGHAASPRWFRPSITPCSTRTAGSSRALQQPDAQPGESATD
ncbi:hypothetical protein CKO28_05960 [Rhodovibrio sodomensis]|uniref:Uncharacterized protein n=2 Tax=Rhodovibrio sodomensis TaxID=1088 RepID=A0ABS1DAT8_9PROT|nr:hypothetical protein [Rhodovibrio sodomensis]